MAKVRQNTSKVDPGSEQELRRITLKGFKATRDGIDVSVRPLTLLAGQNSAGKSTVVQPLLLMKQTLEATHDPGVLELNGPCVKFNEASQLLWQGRSKADKAKNWEITLGVGNDSVKIQYRMKSGGFGLGSTERTHANEVLRLHDRMSEAEKSAAFKSAAFGALPDGYKLEVLVTEDRCAHRLEGQLISSKSKRPLPFIVMRPLPTEMLESIIHLPGLRGHPERAYPVTRAADRYPGAFSPYTASILLAWAEKKDKRLNAVGDDLALLGLTWKVAPKRVDDTHVELRVGRLPRPQQGGAHDLVNIADVGFGASQVLPVVVALHAARPGQVVHIEQPELHLHPNAQVAMAELLMRAAVRGVRLLVETHSSVLLKKVQVAVAEESDGVTPDLIALHWFTRDEEGVTRVATAEIGADGSYGDWPVDFADVEMKVEQDFINAAVNKLDSV
jgi:hypothetical protein